MAFFKNKKMVLLFVSIGSVIGYCAVGHINNADLSQLNQDVIIDMQNAKRIAIIGNSGSGKSTLAKRLHEVVSLPLYHLDQYAWKENWTRPSREEFEKIHHSLCDQESWIIEGVSFRLLEYRVRKADLVIFLDIPTCVCFWRVLKRTLENYGARVLSNASGCVENINERYVRFLYKIYTFKSERLPIIMNVLSMYSESKKIYILTSPQEADALLSQLEECTEICSAKA